ncbi:amidohydrolase family protein [Paenibacillus sacheonensis]|uniref:Amidohydrolase family protein n=1 Tax=Paenibacillus sacheonensis TaxID=742054 RepID=A0A7X4YLC9_9BACL|nr:amidohydrolase family protein [Paenibacillus sacheonensis]MBM7564116.1 L-fuconolactonase [Paenibacillus sacheonensis]NBC67554.1 amidohydrolase family protein [Paenibacillus sacheonensis]
MSRTIDAHQHYWKLDRGDYGWLTPEGGPVLYRDYGPQDLEPDLERAGVRQTIVVQAAATHAETDYMLQLADNAVSIAGVVGWLDFHDPDWKAVLEKFRANPKFVGIRIMIQEMKDAAEVLEPESLEALRYLAEIGLPVDLLMHSKQLPETIQLLKQIPNLHAVIDHIGKPQIGLGVFEPWASQIKALAASHPGLYCKLSGMLTEADHESWEPEQFTAYVRHVVECFGTERVMFGSDWPVCLLAGSYMDVRAVLETALPEGLSEQQLSAIYGGNAAAFYKLPAE